ncbi:hypothetical protein IAR50_006812 [Cryptococcus sp. DSM 104548]
MCRANGMSLAPWGTLGSGKFKDIKVSKALHEVAEEIGGGVRAANVALAWARQRFADCYPIVGGSNPEHLKSNIEALKINLSAEQLDKLSHASDFDLGFPSSYFGTHPHYLPEGNPNCFLLNQAAYLKYTPLA